LNQLLFYLLFALAAPAAPIGARLAARAPAGHYILWAGASLKDPEKCRQIERNTFATFARELPAPGAGRPVSQGREQLLERPVSLITLPANRPIDIPAYLAAAILAGAWDVWEGLLLGLALFFGGVAVTLLGVLVYFSFWLRPLLWFLFGDDP
jgi:hypothetical protein